MNSRNCYCFVPGCYNNTNYNKNMQFVRVPYNIEERVTWFLAAKKNINELNPKNALYCCDAHFKFVKSNDGMNMEVAFSSSTKFLVSNSTQTTVVEPNDKSNQTTVVKCVDNSSETTVVKCEDNSSQTTVVGRLDKSSQTIHFDMSRNHQSTTKFVVTDVTPMKEAHKTGHTASPLSISTATTLTDRSSNLEEYFPSSTNTDSDADIALNAYKTTLLFMKKRPRHYLGINKSCLHIIQILMKKTSLSERQIMLTLRKIRLNEQFQTLGDLFGVDRRTAGRYFRDSVRPISKCIGKFLKYCKPKTIKRNLPISFRRNYNRVGSIFDCFETQIEKPSRPQKQSKSFSKYKACNTVKHMLSVTPDGLINYVSRAYGGRSSDLALCTTSKVGKILIKDFLVMADRGFKGIENVLMQYGSKLVRPPSTTEGQMTKGDVMLTKQIASLRIHVERAINRIRDFDMCKPHVTLDSNLVKYIDDVVVIACGLANIQQQLIKTN